MHIMGKLDVGCARELNEDCIDFLDFSSDPRFSHISGGLLIVADGMGGHNAGEIASQLCTEVFRRECINGLIDGKESLKDGRYVRSLLERAAEACNTTVFSKAGEAESLHGMGTTLSSAIILGQDLYVIHIGDCRCYIINNRETIQVTRDHSYVQEMLDAGLITEDEARSHPQKNVITRVVGAFPEVQSELYQYRLYDGDMVLICSDGLCGVVSTDMISRIVLSAPDLENACDDLIKFTNSIGGPDNISVVIAKQDNLPSYINLLASDTTVNPAANNRH
jgi:PPM family protein phosphatase